MTPEEQSLIMALAVVPGRVSMADEEFLRRFRTTDGARLGLDLLRDAARRRDPTDAELALVVCFHFGLLPGHVDLLIDLAFAQWHQRHEDVASALGKTKSPAAVNALVHLAEWVPDYLEFDDARALAVKAIWALGGIAGDGAKSSLERLSHAPDAIVARTAARQLNGDGS